MLRLVGTLYWAHAARNRIVRGGPHGRGGLAGLGRRRVKLLGCCIHCKRTTAFSSGSGCLTHSCFGLGVWLAVLVGCRAAGLPAAAAAVGVFALFCCGVQDSARHKGWAEPCCTAQCLQGACGRACGFIRFRWLVHGCFGMRLACPYGHGAVVACRPTCSWLNTSACPWQCVFTASSGQHTHQNTTTVVSRLEGTANAPPKTGCTTFTFQAVFAVRTHIRRMAKKKRH